MLGFVAAAAAEASGGPTAAQQLEAAPTAVVAAVALVRPRPRRAGRIEAPRLWRLMCWFSPSLLPFLRQLGLASAIPLLKGGLNASFGPFTPDAERLNGRLAMLGFAAMIALEWASGIKLV